MSYPLIILGAGASFDYVHPSQREYNFKCPPLARDLVNPKYIDKNAKNFRKEIQHLFNKIIPRINSNKSENANFEDVLLEEAIPEQLHALKFYLKDLFLTISNDYFSLNNYSALIRKILEKGNKALVINFNYDNLFERALFDEKWSEFGKSGVGFEKEYISGDIKIIKIHGSCDWSFIIRRSKEKENFFNISDGYSYLKINGFPDFSISPEHVMYHDNYLDSEDKRDEFYRIPVLIPPIIGKNKFVCPSRHTQILNEEIEKIDKILIIGWAVGDLNLIELIKEKIKSKNEIVIVSSPSDINLIEKKINTILPNLTISAKMGEFSKFLGSTECKTFFGG